MHATQYLKNPPQHNHGPIVVLFGSEPHLKQSALEALREQVLGVDSDEISLVRLDGAEAELRDVVDELRLVSMWGDQKLVYVDQASEFVTRSRTGLESYLRQPARKAVLVLNVKSWPKTTRLAKQTTEVGLCLECSELKGDSLIRWLVDQARDMHQKKLTRDAASLMRQLAGSNLGLLDQELSKLAAFVGQCDQIDVDDVRGLVGGWKTETTWTMLDAIRDGSIATALDCLDKLLIAGEAPLKILGGVNYVYRKYAKATQRAAQGQKLNAALKDAGVFPRDVQAVAAYLRRIGRPRAERILPHLISADQVVKGGSSLP
ncbi:MAG: DNA polymerase III subunit delta, partial [Planctomycetaceae bacterium]